MLRTRRTGSMILMTMLLATNAACGAAGGPKVGWSDDEGGGSLGPQLNVTLSLSGATTLAGDQTAAAPTNNGTIPASCAEYAKGSTGEEGRTFYVGAGLLDGPVAGRRVTLELWIEEYTGPGTYPKGQLVAPGSRPSIAVDGTVYGTWPDSTSSEVVTDDRGGGTWTFAKLATTGAGGLPGDAVDGTVTWTCRDA
ncbi:hypothetical protein ACGFIR_15145 [Micromonospora sp. NPDC049051]|uniref:hypothetical protein n=1 Tax=Micromonospora sp. NPDC049051 TaxID=3364264 RepID=UPI003716969A